MYNSITPIAALSARDLTLPSAGSRTAIVDEGFQFGRYRVQRCLGLGGMGTVYRALDTVLNRTVALKTISTTAELAQITAGLRFFREAEVIAKLDHPHIVRLYDVGVQEQTPYLILEHLEGMSLAGLLSQHRRMNPNALLSLLLPVLDGIAHAHHAGVLHLDLKPANIFVGKDYRGSPHPKVLDFGVCSLSSVDPELDPTRHEHAGTPAYMPPEVLDRSPARESTDQFALGVILYECLTGLHPFARANSLAEMQHMMLRSRQPALEALCPSLPRDLGQIVSRAMSPNPNQRFASVRAMGAALANVASEPQKSRWSTEFAKRH